MNALIYDENSGLFVRKPNGLHYNFDNVDKPELGFDFDVLVYDDIEVKILEWKDGVNFNDQEHVQLTDEEKDAIENYIANSEPPLGHSLNQQYINEIYRIAMDNIQAECKSQGFDDLYECVYAGREGSSHPRRSLARRGLEFADATHCSLDQICSEIQQTREDTLKDIEAYLMLLPPPQYQVST